MSAYGPNHETSRTTPMSCPTMTSSLITANRPMRIAATARSASAHQLPVIRPTGESVRGSPGRVIPGSIGTLHPDAPDANDLTRVVVANDFNGTDESVVVLDG